MAIRIEIKCDDHEQMVDKILQFHEALKDSPAYADDEIALLDTGADTFTLFIGIDNDDDIDITI